MRKVIAVFNKLEEWTLVFVLLTLAFISFVQVICRYLLGFSFNWLEEVIRYVGVFIAFLGASLGVKYGTHFSMDFLYENIGNDRFRHGLKLAVGLIAAVLLLVVAWYGWEQAMKLRRFGAGMSVLPLPKYVAYLPIPVFSVFISGRFLILGWRHVKGLLHGEPFSLLGGKP